MNANYKMNNEKQPIIMCACNLLVGDAIQNDYRGMLNVNSGSIEMEIKQPLK